MTNVEIFSAYLPYEVKCKYGYNRYEIVGINNGIVQYFISIRSSKVELLPIIGQVKLVLKPLDTIDWHKVEVDMGEFLTSDMIEFIWNAERSSFNILDAPYLLVQWLIKNHYDVFGAIEKGIAISE